MSRFTKKSTKFLSSYEWNRDLPTKTFVQLGINKLGQLEDIEEELGIDLITLFKVLSKGSVYINRAFCPEDETYLEVKGYKRITLHKVPNEEDINDFIKGNWVLDFSAIYGDYIVELVVNVKDYGRTWALTREEFEKQI